MRHYHVVVEFAEPIGHARAFAHISESQVKRHFILPWANGNLPIGPDRDVAATEVSRLRVFRAVEPEEALVPADATMAGGVAQDVTDLFLSEAGIHTKSSTTRQLLWLASAAAVIAALAMLRP
jgi:hypothetical protein